MRISAPLMQFPDVPARRLKVAQGLLMASPFTWDMNP
jgi:branched-chain amino acid transport system substrate-binding protein